MANNKNRLVFEQIHIDVARNATDDFNPFHDKKRWQRIRGNPFSGPIVLGFQLECLLEDHFSQYREANNEKSLIEEQNLRFSNYQISFANAVKPGDEVIIDIRASKYSKGDNPSISNRFSIKSGGHLDAIGFKRETREGLYLADTPPPELGDLRQYPDRAYLPNSDFYLKRKYMNTSNGKNFLAGSLVEQSKYFDELEDRVEFPETFLTGLLSCALLERASQEKHDFIENPMVYTSHKLSIDREGLLKVRSNTVLNMLVAKCPPAHEEASAEKDVHNYHCYGLIDDNELLYSAVISLAPLATVVSCQRTKRK